MFSLITTHHPLNSFIRYTAWILGITVTEMPTFYDATTYAHTSHNTYSVYFIFHWVQPQYVLLIFLFEIHVGKPYTGCPTESR